MLFFPLADPFQDELYSLIRYLRPQVYSLITYNELKTLDSQCLRTNLWPMPFDLIILKICRAKCLLQTIRTHIQYLVEQSKQNCCISLCIPQISRPT